MGCGASSRSGSGGIHLTPSAGVRIMVAIVHCFTWHTSASGLHAVPLEEIEKDLRVDLDSSEEEDDDHHEVRVSMLKK